MEWLQQIALQRRYFPGDPPFLVAQGQDYVIGVLEGVEPGLATVAGDRLLGGARRVATVGADRGAEGVGYGRAARRWRN